MLSLLRNYPEEIATARQIGESFKLDGMPEEINKIIVLGMGGSAIGGDFLRCYLKSSCTVPVIVNRSYTLPKWVDQKTLVFACSFSGNTEETLKSVNQLKQSGACVICLTSGGKLAALARANHYSVISLANSRPPRTAFCFLALPMIVTLERAGIINDQTLYFKETIKIASDLISECEANDSIVKNLTYSLVGKLPVIYSSDVMEAVGSRWRCQFNENSKILALSNIVPEMNHNEITGWNPCTAILEKTHVIMIRDENDLPRIQKRFEINKTIIQKQNVTINEVFSKGESLLARMMSLIIIGDYTSFYLAILNQVNPTEIENINFLKQELDRFS